MKKLITFICTLSAILFLIDARTYAQGSGGRSPSVAATQTRDGHGPNAGHGSANQGKDADNRDAHSTINAREAHKDTDFVEHIEHNSALKTKVESLLPAGVDLKTAADGFKNEGQFIAALHVSKNLNIPFADLKAKMTGPNPESLGHAIHDLRPNLPEKEANKEAEKAE